MRTLHRRRSSGRRRPTNWTGNGQVAESTQAAGTQSNLIIVAPDDYQPGQVSQNTEPGGATLLRIRGSLDLRATIIGGLALCGIYILGANEPAAVLNTAIALTTGDCLWMDTFMVPIDTARHVEIDVKAKRKLENDQVVFSIFAVAQTVTYLSNFRALLGIGGR